MKTTRTKRLTLKPMKKIVLGTMLVGGLIACKKPKDEDKCAPLRTQVETLTNDYNISSNAVRTAVVPARDGIVAVFDTYFGDAMAKKTQPYSFADTASGYKETVEDMRAAFGDPIPVNNETLSALHTKAVKCLNDYVKLEAARQSLSECK